jgi:hypothetical protein
MKRFRVRGGLLALVVLPALFPAFTAFAFELDPALHYSTSESAINAYDDTGALVDSLPYGDGELRGAVIGPDDRMHVAQLSSQPPHGAYVDTLDPTGRRIARRWIDAPIAGNISYGKLAYARDARLLYLATGHGVFEIKPEARAGAVRRLTGKGAYGVDVLPDGNLLVANDYALAVHSPDGALLSEFTDIDDPDGLAGTSNPWLVNVRGVAYSDATDRTYVTMLGYTGFYSRLLAFDGTSNRLVGVTTWHGNDIHVDDAGNLLVGSGTQAPAWFSPELDMLGQLDGPPARFVAGFRELYFDPDCSAIGRDDAVDVQASGIDLVQP